MKTVTLVSLCFSLAPLDLTHIMLSNGRDGQVTVHKTFTGCFLVVELLHHLGEAKVKEFLPGNPSVVFVEQVLPFDFVLECLLELGAT